MKRIYGEDLLPLYCRAQDEVDLSLCYDAPCMNFEVLVDNCKDTWTIFLN